MKHIKNKLVLILFTTAMLTFIYWWGGNAPTLRGWVPKDAQISENTEISSDVTEPQKTESLEQLSSSAAEEADALGPAPSSTAEESESPSAPMQEYTDEMPAINTETTNDHAHIPENTEPPSALTCTLSVRCDTILQNMSWLEKGKADIIPKNGIIFAESAVSFYEGESVFNVLLREMKKNKIHFEYVNTPLYNSAYIEGIGNIYEFDCGELSGWVYRVNGIFPDYGCSRYILEVGDKIELLYTCDLGKDVGSNGGLQKDE